MAKLSDTFLGLCRACVPCSCGEVGQWPVASMGRGSTRVIYHRVGLKFHASLYFPDPMTAWKRQNSERLAELKINTYARSKINASKMDAKLQAGSQSNVDAEIQTGSDIHSDGDVDTTVPIAMDRCHQNRQCCMDCSEGYHT